MSCKSNDPIHDIKVNIRKNSIYEESITPLNILYYLTIFYFMKKLSIDKTSINTT